MLKFNVLHIHIKKWQEIHLNTSYVKVQYGTFSGTQFLQHNLNTSYVKVQFINKSFFFFFCYNLNTSYVKVQLNGQVTLTALTRFKYILC